MGSAMVMRKSLVVAIGLLLVVLLSAGAYTWHQLRDRHPGYAVDIDITAPDVGVVRAGFAATSITPEITDTWTDVSGNFQYRPNEGDTYEDVTGSGRFDAVWMAGFQNAKPAQGVHDDLWARAMVLDDGQTRLAWVVLDAIGFSADDVIEVRKRLPETIGVDYAIVSSTHTHSAPDLLGLWGPRRFTSGVDPAYKEKVINAAVAAISQAVDALQPARIRFAVDEHRAESMIADTRKPIVINGALRMMQAIDAETGTTLGTLVSWDNHPETIWNENLLITSDFPHYLREGIENGVWDGESLVAEGLGGIAIFAPGNIGGLMTTDPSLGIRDPFSDTVYVEPSFEKVRAQGLTLALLSMEALRSEAAVEIERGGIALRARSVELPMDNRLYRLGAIAGLFDRGLTGWMRIRSEISIWRLGPAEFLHHPGELYPEIADGGVEAPEGQDFAILPQEVPPLRSVMTGQFTFISGLSNDMIGYIIPKSQWDERPPHTYDSDKPPYGEINSLGPETAPLLHSAMMELMQGF